MLESGFAEKNVVDDALVFVAPNLVVAIAMMVMQCLAMLCFVVDLLLLMLVAWLNVLPVVVL